MSHEAIAAALARGDLSCGERLVAFSLASFADRENHARPGTPAAAGRAGFKRSWFLEARELLKRRGLVVVEQAATGRGRASTLWLAFAHAGPWWDGEINAELFEAVLGYSRAQGAARLLLAAAAALADEQRVVESVTTGELRAAAGLSDTTYRRARIALLASRELVLRSGTGGRGKTNCWEIADPRSRAGEIEAADRRRVAPPRGQRPLVVSVSAAATAAHEQPGSAVDEVDSDDEGRLASAVKGGGDRTLCAQNHPVGGGVSETKGAAGRTLSAGNRPVVAGVSVTKGAAGRTLSPLPRAETPPETPPPNARAGREPQNPRTIHPPSPPEGGSGRDQVLVEETYLTERGRRRRRLVTVDVDTLRARLVAARPADRDAWEQVRRLLLGEVGESTFGIWLGQLALIAVDRDGSLVIDTPVDATRAWVPKRFGPVLERCAAHVGRVVRFAQERERLAVELREGDAPPSPACLERDGADAPPTAVTPRRVASRASARAASAPVGRSPCSSQTPVYDQEREVS